MPIVHLKEIQVTFGTDAIFDKLEMKVFPGEKVGLVGSNGCGKTTILKVILGQVESDLGYVHARKGIRIAYLPQEPQMDPEKTVLEELHSSAEDVKKLQLAMDEASEQISHLSGDRQEEAMRRYDRLVNEFELAGGYDYETRIKEISAGVGLDDKFHNSKTSQLSGGQLSRLGLAKVLLTGADLLLLDEPTNHLDWEANVWLERFLRNYKGAALIVSHDRFLLDRLVTRIIEIRGRRAEVYGGNYSTYRIEKEKRDLELQRQHDSRVEYLDRTRDFIARNINQEGMSKVARGRRKYLDRILKCNPDFLDRPTYEKELDFEFSEVKDKGQRLDVVLEYKNVTQTFDQLTLFEGLDVEVLRGSRLGIIGPNGTGKSTLLKLALGRMQPSSGNITLKRTLSVGYLDQSGEELNNENTALQELSQVAPEMTNEKLRSMLGAFLFSADDVFKLVGDLSGGERNRLALCKLVLASPEILVLDEPTNHLDIPSTEALERALLNYTGTLIVVSHDRYFLQSIADMILVVGADEYGKKSLGSYEVVTGSYSEYEDLLEKRMAERLQKQKQADGNKPKRAGRDKPKQVTPPELKQFNAWAVEKIEAEVEKVETEIEQMQNMFGDESVYKDHLKLAKLQNDVAAREEYLDLLYRAFDWRASK